MSRRTSVISAIVGLAAALSLTVPALAKEGAEARLDTALPREAEPGSTIEIGWSVFAIEGEATQPISGSPVYVRLVGPDGAASEVMGTETPAGSGHYTASIQVPAGGIAEVIVGLTGEACTAGVCQRSDMIFPLTDDPLVTGAARSVEAETSTPSVSSQLVPLVAIGVAIALAGGLAATAVGRRREVRQAASR